MGNGGRHDRAGHLRPPLLSRAGCIRGQFRPSRRSRSPRCASTIEGQTVVDLWGGISNRSTMSPWQRDTIGVVWSATKGAVALCADVLAARGRLDLDAPVARYWPEFARHDKEDIPVRGSSTIRPACPPSAGRCARRTLRVGRIVEIARRRDALLAARHAARISRQDLRASRRRGGSPGVGARPGTSSSARRSPGRSVSTSTLGCRKKTRAASPRPSAPIRSRPARRPGAS